MQAHMEKSNLKIIHKKRGTEGGREGGREEGGERENSELKTQNLVHKN